MYINNVTPRARSPLAEGKGTRPTRNDQHEFGEALESVLIADAVEVAYFDPEDKERRKQQESETADSEPEIPAEIQTELFNAAPESVGEGIASLSKGPVSEEKHSLDIKV